ncbi:hypothetical protein QCE88_18370 [Caballeronia sp. LZ035]|nr:hypothetical protein [Caballeronia sp. LZ035]MDR5758923.1 hypothetical protein [Caballeronia sp. LZ035]
MMAGNQGHRPDRVGTFPFVCRQEAQAFADARDAFVLAGDTIMGSDVWIGSEEMIMPGVHIGYCVMIGSQALVTKHVEPDRIVCGDQAKPIRKRFADDEKAMLLEMAGWDCPLEAIVSVR